MENKEDLGSNEGCDNMYNPDPNKNTVMAKKQWGAVAASVGLNKNKNKRRVREESTRAEKKKSKKLYDEYNSGIPTKREISFLPAIFCLTIHADGTQPDVQKILELANSSPSRTDPQKKRPVRQRGAHGFGVREQGRGGD